MLLRAGEGSSLHGTLQVVGGCRGGLGRITLNLVRTGKASTLDRDVCFKVLLAQTRGGVCRWGQGEQDRELSECSPSAHSV